MFGIDLKIFLLLGVAVIAWVCATALLPRIRLKIFDSGADDVANVAASLAGASILRSIGSTVTLSMGAAIGVFLLMRGWLAWYGDDPAQLERIVDFRDRLEWLLNGASLGFAGLWLVGLLLLVGIWVQARRSSAHKRWTDAAHARLSAITASLAGLSSTALREQLGMPLEEESALRQKFMGYANRNAERIAALRGEPVVKIGEDGAPLSIEDLVQLHARFLEQADSEDSEKEAHGAIAFASHIKENIHRLEAEIKITLETPEGNRVTVALVEAPVLACFDKDCAEKALDAALHDALLTACAKKHVRQHVMTKPAEDRSEPELITEWIGTAVTSGAAVQASSGLGRFGARAAMVAVVISVLGFAAAPLGANILEHAYQLELSLLETRESAKISEALAGTSSIDSRNDENASAEQADDEATEAHVRHVIRSRLAAGLLARIPEATERARAHRSAFQIAAVEARRAILQASERPAAPRLDPEAYGQAFESNRPRGQSASAVDAIIDSRVAKLREHPGTWAALRREAARPARSSEGAEALYRTAFGVSSGDDVLGMIARHRTAEIAADIARGGTGGGVPGSISLPPLTARERRLVSDFQVGLPSQLDVEMERFRSGTVDPGSLNRVVMRSGEIRGGNSPRTVARPVSHYDNLFPTVEAGRPSIGEPSPGRLAALGEAGHSSGAVARSARSFSLVRFSSKVGGVVIGREPERVAPTISVTGMRWRVQSDGHILIELTSGKRSIALGPFSPAIVHQALAYAADGRVVTVTLPKPDGDHGSGMPESVRRVAVHPALEDTSLACRAIQLDRFVDTFMYLGQPNETTRRIQVMRKGVDSLSSILGVLAVRGSQDRHEFIDTLVKSGELEQGLAPVASAARLCRDIADCFPVAYYSDLDFGGEALRDYLSCAAVSPGSECVDRFRDVEPQHYFLVDSGVREVAYEVDTEFRFLTGSPNGNDALWPLDFIVQAIPAFLEDDPDEVERLQLAVTQEPWVFPEFAKDLRSEVAAGIASQPNARRIFGEMRDFTILQRLFRTALNGDLGDEFPLSRLASLQAETISAVKVVRHERWNLNQALQMFFVEKQEELIMSMRKVAQSQGANTECKARIASALKVAETGLWPPQADVWRLLGKIDAVCPGVKSPEKRALQRIRDALRAEELIDEAILYSLDRPYENEPFGCPAL